ncbi:septum site-determining protein MinC [Gracilibacillus marinus]|jgi:septum site-determining protein MinC|uniref:Probable septum site-determining protein MinC n=1 Tax=Gracilibacillus marinus TaxID=630535 RepID=A0ABV8VXM6_9BACI
MIVAGNRCITIKGTRDGLILFMDDTCAFNDLLVELETVLMTKYLADDEQSIRIKVELGNRYVTESQEAQLKALFDQQQKFIVEEIVSNVILKQTALDWKEDTAIKLHNKVIRSGQVLEVNGDLLLIGDVNPGGKVVATGNIYILGYLRGIAHAGVDGNKSAVVAASYMAPTQLRIANIISRPSDQDKDGGMMECGYIDETGENILMDRMHALSRLRSELNAFERRILHG